MVTGLGGIFIKAADPKFLARWYEDNLGIGFGTTLYFSFKWREIASPDDISHTVFSFFRDDTTYFYPGTNDVMLNLRVKDLDDMRIRLRNDGVTVIDKVETYEYGRFGWVLDPEGNKIELWEPVDEGFEDRNKPMELGDVTDLGGVYIKCPIPESLMQWYAKQFGLFFYNSAHAFKVIDLYDKNKINEIVLAFYPDDSAYFSPSDKTYMLSFNVKDLAGLLKNLKSSGIVVSEKMEHFSHGKFGWVIDPEGNKVELREELAN